MLKNWMFAALMAVMTILVSKSASADDPPGGPPAEQTQVCQEKADLQVCKSDLATCQNQLAACSKPAAPLPQLPKSFPKPVQVTCGNGTVKNDDGTAQIQNGHCVCLPGLKLELVVSAQSRIGKPVETCVQAWDSVTKFDPPKPQPSPDMSKYAEKKDIPKAFDPKGLATEAWVNKKLEERPIAPNVLPLPADQRLWALIGIGGTFRIGNRNDFNVGGGGAFSVTIFPWEVVGLHLKAEIGALNEPSDQAQIGKLWYGDGSIGPSIRVDHNGRFVANLGVYVEQHWREASKGRGLTGENLGWGVGGMLSAGIRPVSWITFEPYIAVCAGPTSGWERGEVAQDPLLPKINGGLRVFATIPIFGKK